MPTKTDAIGNLIITAAVESRPHVLLFNSNPEELQRWIAAIEGRCTFHSASDLDEVERRLTAEPTDIVVAEWREGLLDRLQNLKQGQLIHCGSTLHEAVVDAAEHNIRFSHVQEPDELLQKIVSLTFPRSETARHPGEGLVIKSLDGAEYPLLDISNEGFCFRVAVDQFLDHVLPGTRLTAFQIARNNVPALTGVVAMVRHLQLEERRGKPYYAVGCEMQRLTPEPQTGQLTFIRDRAVCAGLIRRALKSGGIGLYSEDGAQIGVHCTAGQVDPIRSELQVPGTPHDFTEYEVVHGRFEMHGSVYRFSTSVKARRPLTIRLPGTLEVGHLRSSGRFRPPAQDPVVVEMSSALYLTPMTREVRDISSLGFALDLDPHLDLFPIGTQFDKITLVISGQRFACRGEVKNLSRLSGREVGVRCGIEFQDMAEQSRLQLANIIMGSLYPEVEDGRSVSFERLWKFFIETGFIYPKKEELLQSQLPSIKHTMDALNSRPSKVFKSVVAVRNGNVVGHISGVRGYRKTLINQHLAAAVGHNVGATVNMGLVEYIDQNPDILFCKTSFQPKNKWPARIFGGFAKNIADPHLSDLRTFGYISLPVTFALPVRPSMRIVDASEGDLRYVEQYFVNTEKGLTLRSDDLTKESLRLEEVNAYYQELGLERKRRILMAVDKDVLVGFALVEISSPGLNFSELLSTFRTFVIRGHEFSQKEIRAALIQGSLAAYATAGRPSGVGLVAQEEFASYAALGIEIDKQYSIWTCQRALYRRFNDYAERVLKSFMARANLAGAGATRS